MYLYDMNTKFGDAVKNPDVMQILKKNLLFISAHPRFSEAYCYTFSEILGDNMGEIIGVPSSLVERTVSEILSLKAQESEE